MLTFSTSVQIINEILNCIMCAFSAYEHSPVASQKKSRQGNSLNNIMCRMMFSFPGYFNTFPE